MNKIPYRPLPPCLTIASSPIEGLGIFTTQDIARDTFMGITHIVPRVLKNTKELHDQFPILREEWIRTPLGGFLNHSDEPNCALDECQGIHTIKTLRKILKGEEITVKYTWCGWEETDGN